MKRQICVEIWENSDRMWEGVIAIDDQGAVIEECSGYITHYTFDMDDDEAWSNFAMEHLQALKIGRCVVSYEDETSATQEEWDAAAGIVSVPP